jgi:hypothetical protein
MRRRWLIAGALLLATCYGACVAHQVRRRHYEQWLPGYARWWWSKDAERPGGTTHVMFFYMDHFEPGRGTNRMQRWEREYPAFAQTHRDHEKRPVQHTWAYPVEQPIAANMIALAHLASGGYGEVEVHYHHSTLSDLDPPARYEAVQTALRGGIRFIQQYGFGRTTDGRTQFGFVHGNFALDNSRFPNFCGIDEELKLLRGLGAYADFSFPAIWTRAQPSTVNAIYEALDTPAPKSYDTPWPFQASPSERLPIFMGPLVLAPVLKPQRAFVWIEDANIHAAVPTTRERVDLWISANIHVPGRPEWIFVKVWGHSVESDAEVANNLAGGSFETALDWLESHYNDGRKYALHYVTAREAYNVARAAAAGKSGDPTAYYDYEVKPYLANRRTLEAGRAPLRESRTAPTANTP